MGLTFVYALSGIAINHLDDWDPNFKQIEESFALPNASSTDGRDLNDSAELKTFAGDLMKELGRSEQVMDVYAVDEEHIDISLSHSTLYVDLTRRTVREEGQKPRWILRAMNWLHLNRGKKAWTYIADGYAVFLIFLATSGLYMLPGKKGWIGRRGILTLLGAALPILYVVLSEGP